jgi:regulatory protein
LKDSLAKVRKYALMLLSYRDRSEKEIKERLERKGFEDEYIKAVIGEFKEKGLIDESKFARILKEDTINRKYLSINSAKQHIVKKGIPKDVVEQIFSEEKIDDTETARRLIERRMKMLETHSKNEIAKKLYNLLIRKGYSYEIIRKILIEQNLL